MKKTYPSAKLLIANLILAQLILIQSAPLYAADSGLSKSIAQNAVTQTAGTKTKNSPIQANINLHAPAQTIPPGDLQNIQMIGRSVLAAKHEAQPDPDAIQLKLRLQAIHDNLVKLSAEEMPIQVSETKAEINAVSNAAISTDATKADKNPESQPAVKAKSEHAQKTQKLESDLVQKTHQLRLETDAIKTKHHRDNESNDAHEKSGMAVNPTHLAEKTQALVAEVDDALADKSEQRSVRLAKLRDRLTTKSLGEMQAKTESEPTFSTLTHHRE